MRFLELLTRASLLITSASGFGSWGIGQTFRRRYHDKYGQSTTLTTAAPRPIAGSSKPFVNSTSPRKYPVEKPSYTKSSQLQEVETLIRCFSSNQDVNAWMKQLAEKHRGSTITTTNMFEQFTWQDEIDLITLLRSVDAIDAIFTFMINFSQLSRVIVFNTALEAISRSRLPTAYRREACSRLLEVMNKRKLQPTFRTFACLIHAADDPKTILEIIETIQPVCNLTVERNIYEAAIMACSRNSSDSALQRWETALHLYFRLRQNGMDASLQTYESLLRACARIRQVPIALTLLEEVKRNTNIETIPSSIWEAALNVCAQNGRFNEAIQIVRDMEARDCQLTCADCMKLLTLFSKTDKDMLALALIDAMIGKRRGLTLPSDRTDSKFTVAIPSCKPSLVMINAAITACARAGNEKDAFALFSRLKQGEFLDPKVAGSELYPDELSYNTVLSSCKDPNRAKTLLREMRLSRRNRYGAVPPSNITYTYAIASCRKAPVPDLDTARFFLRNALDDGVIPDVFMYSAAIWTAEKKGDSDAALQFLDDIKVSNCTPNIVSYNGVISALAVTGKYEQAVAVFVEMKERNVRPTSMTYMKLAKVLRPSHCSEDVVPLLMNVVELMDHNERTGDIGAPIFEALIGILGSTGRFDEALETFNMMEGPPGVSCLRSILFQCRAASPPKWEEAVEILHASDIIGAGVGTGRIDQNALSHAVVACCKANQWEEALNILGLYGRPIKAVRNSQNDQSGCLSLSALNSAISACGRGGRPDLALQLFNTMEQKFGVRPDSSSYRNIVIVCNQAQHEQSRRSRSSPDARRGTSDFEWWECALSLLRRFKEEGFSPDPCILSSAISACESARKWQRALGILQSTMAASEGMSVLNLYCFNAAISACEKGGAWVEAIEIYERMKSIGGSLRPNFVTLNSLLVALDKAGQKELAQSMYLEGERMGVVQPWIKTRDNAGNSIRALDMHKLSAPTAKAALRSWLETIATGKQKQSLDDDLVIIAGKGLGSEGNKPVLMPALQECLKQEYGINGIVDDDNPGRLIIKAVALRKFVSTRRW